MSREEDESWGEYKARAESLLEAAENNKANNNNNNNNKNNNNDEANNNNNNKANKKATSESLLKEEGADAENEGGGFLEEETNESAAMRYNNNKEEKGKEALLVEDGFPKKARAESLLKEEVADAENEGGAYLEEETNESATMRYNNKKEEKSLWNGFLTGNAEWMSNAAEGEESRTENNWEAEDEDYGGGRQGSVGPQQVRGGEQLDQTLNRNSQDGEQEGISFASSLGEDGRDSPGIGLEEEEGSGNEMEDSGVAFPFLDHPPQQENQADVKFGGENKADLEKVNQA